MSLDVEYRISEPYRSSPTTHGGLKRPFEVIASCWRLYPIPPPPRRTSLFFIACGLQAKPSCGPQLFLLVPKRSPPCFILIPVRTASPAPSRGLLICPSVSVSG